MQKAGNKEKKRMKIEIENEFCVHWSDDMYVKLSNNFRDNLVDITCNKSGLINLAKMMLEFAYFAKEGDWFHLINKHKDLFNAVLAEDSCEFAIKIEDKETSS
jgi:hypothetical protein